MTVLATGRVRPQLDVPAATVGPRCAFDVLRAGDFPCVLTLVRSGVLAWRATVLG